MQFLGDTLKFPGLPPLHAAAKRGNVPAIRWLLEQGVDVNKAIPFSQATPLHFAVDSGHAEATDVLLTAGADPFVLARAFRRLTYSFGPQQALQEEEDSFPHGVPQRYLASELARTRSVRAVLEKHRHLRFRMTMDQAIERQNQKKNKELELAREEKTVDDYLDKSMTEFDMAEEQQVEQGIQEQMEKLDEIMEEVMEEQELEKKIRDAKIKEASFNMDDATAADLQDAGEDTVDGKEKKIKKYAELTAAAAVPPLPQTPPPEESSEADKPPPLKPKIRCFKAWHVHGIEGHTSDEDCESYVNHILGC